MYTLKLIVIVNITSMSQIGLQNCQMVPKFVFIQFIVYRL